MNRSIGHGYTYGAYFKESSFGERRARRVVACRERHASLVEAAGLDHLLGGVTPDATASTRLRRSRRGAVLADFTVLFRRKSPIESVASGAKLLGPEDEQRAVFDALLGAIAKRVRIYMTSLSMTLSLKGRCLELNWPAPGDACNPTLLLDLGASRAPLYVSRALANAGKGVTVGVAPAAAPKQP